MLLVAALVALHILVRDERIPLIAGESVGYLRWVETWGDDLAQRRLTDWELSRSLPSGALWVVFRLLGLATDQANAVRGYVALNAVMALVVGFAWTRAARLVPLSARGAWVGLAGLLLGYAALKEAQFRPFLTDMPALALGALALWAYLADRPLALAALSVVGAFTWPVALPTGLLLLLLPRAAGVGPAPWRAAPRVAGAAAAVAFLVTIELLLRRGAIDPVAQLPPMVDLFWLAEAIGAVTVFFAVGALVDREDLLRPATLPWRRALTRLPLAIAAVLLVKLLMARGSSGTAMPEFAPGTGLQYGPALFIDMCLYRGIKKPGVFLLSHAMYFGPLFVLLFARGGAFAAALRAHGGAAPALVLLGAVVLLLNSESRQAVHTWPLVVPFVALAGEPLWRSTRFFAGVMALAVFASRVWVPYLHTPLGWEAWQFTGMGPWMTQLGYAVALLVTAPIVLALAWAARSGTGASQPDPDTPIAPGPR